MLIKRFVVACGLGLAPAVWAGSIVASAEVAQVLNQAYGGFLSARDCWIHNDLEEGRYCMSLVRADRLQVDDHQRTYLILSGNLIDETGEDAGAHVNSGRVGAFVLDTTTAPSRVIAGRAAIPLGVFGRGPDKWQWVKLGPDNYWGWIAYWGDAHGGYAGTRPAILAPYGRSIRDLAGFTISYSDSGACADADCERRATSLEGQLEIDAARVDQRVFPLRVTLSGQYQGKPYGPQSTEFHFDSKSWRYKEPEGWLLKHADY